MEMRPYLLHALSPLHAGTGQAADVIDLPIARMKGTGIPIVPGSSIKGVLRDWFDQDARLDKETHRAVFGPATDEEAADHAGALMVHDARLVALPVRSFRGTFAWVSSPLLLDLARRDLRGHGAPTVHAMDKRRAVTASASPLNVHTLDVPRVGKTAKVYLEDLDLEVEPTGRALARRPLATWAALDRLARLHRGSVGCSRVASWWSTTRRWPSSGRPGRRSTRGCASTAETRTVAKGALWAEESLPPETLLVGPHERRQEPSREEGPDPAAGARRRPLAGADAPVRRQGHGGARALPPPACRRRRAAR